MNKIISRSRSKANEISREVWWAKPSMANYKINFGGSKLEDGSASCCFIIMDWNDPIIVMDALFFIIILIFFRLKRGACGKVYVLLWLVVLRMFVLNETILLSLILSGRLEKSFGRLII